VSIEVKNLSFGYGSHEVMRNVSFTAEEGKLLAVLGPNGAGKSTLFRCILGLLHGYHGSILLNGEDVRGMRPARLAKKIAYIPQTHHPAFQFSVADMVLMGTAHQVGMLRAPAEFEREQALAAMRQTGIEHLAKKSYLHLSGGEQQLVLIARALAQQAKVLLMDEPTSNLDYGNQQRVLERIRGLTKQGYTVVLSTHNPQHALHFADNILALFSSSVAAFGAPQEVLDEALLKKLYGVDVALIETHRGHVLFPVLEEGD
jgi:ABC-type cobalamin/Fe3+-siderophores transport system ATPase subunit